MGWLGWTPDTALDTPMPLVALALEGRARMMRTQFETLARIFGGGPEPEPEAPDPDTVAEKAKGILGRMAAKHARQKEASL